MVQAIDVGTDELEQAHEELRQYGEPLCKKMEETDLPPFRAINHTIPLIDENKKYLWCPSQCPEPFRTQWTEKRDAYLNRPLENYFIRKHNSHAPDPETAQKGYATAALNSQ